MLIQEHTKSHTIRNPFHPNVSFVGMNGESTVSSDGYACSGPGLPVVVSCAERERPSRPSCSEEGSGLEAPWLRLANKKKKMLAHCKFEKRVRFCRHVSRDD